MLQPTSVARNVRSPSNLLDVGQKLAMRSGWLGQTGLATDEGSMVLNLGCSLRACYVEDETKEHAPSGTNIGEVIDLGSVC